MRGAPVQRRAFTYKVTEEPGALAVSLADIKSHLKETGSSEDDLITIYLEAAIDYAERLTKRDFITRTYTTFRDFFPGVSEGYYQFGNLPTLGTSVGFGGNIGFEIRKSPLQSIESIKYFVSDVLTTVLNTDYYNTLEEDYSEVLIKDDKCWPTNADVRLQTIEISFKAGFGNADSDMPNWVSTGIMQHVAELHANRGDCSSESEIKNNLPAAARMLYMQNRIENL